MKSHSKRRIKYIVVLVVLIIGLLYIKGPRKYTNADFDIAVYQSVVDKDSDGIDDQTDILGNAKAYVKTRPRYKSKYYATGYPDDGYGVCTDVVAQAFINAGYDLMTLVNEDILKHPDSYEIDIVDKNIDFRRVRNLLVYFKNTALELTLDIADIEAWQGGDVVVFEGHIGIVSDHRTHEGIPFVIHHAKPWQLHYEERVLGKIPVIGHFRIR